MTLIKKCNSCFENYESWTNEDTEENICLRKTLFVKNLCKKCLRNFKLIYKGNFSYNFRLFCIKIRQAFKLIKYKINSYMK